MRGRKFALGAAAVVASLTALGFGPAAIAAGAASTSSQSLCIGHHPQEYLQFQPLQIKGVTFGDGSSAKSWAAVSDYGGKAEVDQSCGAANYGSPFCTYPWYAFNGTDNAFTYGGDYAGTTNDFGQALQFQQQNCVSPAGPFAQYCSTVLR